MNGQKLKKMKVYTNKNKLKKQKKIYKIKQSYNNFIKVKFWKGTISKKKKFSNDTKIKKIACYYHIDNIIKKKKNQL